MQDKNYVLTEELIQQYVTYLREQERASNTIQKYSHDLNAFFQWLKGRKITKHMLIAWKEQLTAIYAATSVNSMLAAVNNFLKFMDWQELAVRPLKIQKPLFCDKEKELTQREYIRLIEASKREGDERLSLLLQTICATGIRVSELQFITAEAVYLGRAEVSNKGKRRVIFLPDKLCRLLKKYLKKENRITGTVFITRTGKPLDRSNIWRNMKKLCENARVKPGKVFPHNLRHLFARMYYAVEKDIFRLADILGHSSVNTTRLYTVESGRVHARQMEKMGLIIT